ncbi:MAG: sulfurtransferase FdhD [Acidocella sp. 20-63-7]|nr:MAG: sulfurtransferase FdhD [Acidocella sp. 20-63-7]HQT46687.1 formate dehydrogenase accessory sulfurtransferase FdhD [Acidocella sp.]
MTDRPPATQRVAVNAWRSAKQSSTARVVPEETPVAMSYDWMGFAVMMATPADLEDFAIGFSLSEGVISSADEIAALEVVALDQGMECRMTLKSGLPASLLNRRRQFAGPVGCGLCGIEQVQQALRPLPEVSSSLRIPATQITTMLSRMAVQQKLNQVTRAVHAAAFFRPGSDDVLLREDVGRHNALDKLVGALARRGDAPSAGVVLLTSRVSIELIQKTALMGAPILAAISVPTALAIREAQAAGITLIAVAREDGFEVFTHPERIIYEAQSHVA